MPTFSEDEDKSGGVAGSSAQNKEKVKTRPLTVQHHSINLTNLAANQSITTVPISADASAALAAQGVNVCATRTYILTLPHTLLFLNYHFSFAKSFLVICFALDLCFVFALVLFALFHLPLVYHSLTLPFSSQALYAQPITHYAPTMVQTINNPDGTVSIIQMDPSAVVSLPDGTQAQVRTLGSLRVSS